MKPVQVDADRRGYIIATGDDAQSALRVANEASRYLRVRVGRPLVTT